MSDDTNRQRAELHIRIDPDLLARLKRVARRNLVGVNFVVNTALNDWLEEGGAGIGDNDDATSGLFPDYKAAAHVLPGGHDYIKRVVDAALGIGDDEIQHEESCNVFKNAGSCNCWGSEQR